MLSLPSPAFGPLYVFVFVEERQSQEAERRVHQSTEGGGGWGGGVGCRMAGMQCGKESLLSYCSLVSSVSSHPRTSSSLTGKKH